MGSNRLISKDKSKVEFTSLTALFEKQCPIYMAFGMTYDEFWYDDAYRTKFYRYAYKLKVRQKDEELWQQGMYIYEALCEVSPVLHAFCKKGTKPLPYSSKPYLSDVASYKTDTEKAKQIENDRLIARLHFEAWAREMKNRFKEKGGGD